MASKGKGGKKHRRGKNAVQVKIELPDAYQYFAYVSKILGSGRVGLEYYIPKINPNTNEVIDWEQKSKIGVIRGKMLRRKYVNLGDLVLVTERDFDASKVDIIDKYDNSQIEYLRKNSNMPPINEISNNGVEFNFDEKDEDEIDNNKPFKKVNEDYMIGIPTFSDSDDDQ